MTIVINNTFMSAINGDMAKEKGVQFSNQERGVSGLHHCARPVHKLTRGGSLKSAMDEKIKLRKHMAIKRECEMK